MDKDKTKDKVYRKRKYEAPEFEGRARINMHEHGQGEVDGGEDPAWPRVNWPMRAKECIDSGETYRFC